MAERSKVKTEEERFREHVVWWAFPPLQIRRNVAGNPRLALLQSETAQLSMVYKI